MNPSARLGQSSPRRGFILIRNVNFDSSTLGQCAALIDYSLSFIAAAIGHQEAATSRYVLPSKTKPNLQRDGQARVHSPQESVRNYQPWLLCAPHLEARLGQPDDTCWTPPQIAPDRASRKSHGQDISMLSWSTALRNPAFQLGDTRHCVGHGHELYAASEVAVPAALPMSSGSCLRRSHLARALFLLRRHHDRTSRRVFFVCSGWLIERSCTDQVNDQALQVRYEVCKYTY